MIKLDISVALFLYLLFTVVSLLVLWSFFDFGTRLRSFGSDEKFIWHCSICALTYIDSSHEEISRCPQCGSYNQRLSDEMHEETRGPRGKTEERRGEQ